MDQRAHLFWVAFLAFSGFFWFRLVDLVRQILFHPFSPYSNGFFT